MWFKSFFRKKRLNKLKNAFLAVYEDRYTSWLDVVSVKLTIWLRILDKAKK